MYHHIFVHACTCCVYVCMHCTYLKHESNLIEDEAAYQNTKNTLIRERRGEYPPYLHSKENVSYVLRQLETTVCIRQGEKPPYLQTNARQFSCSHSAQQWQCDFLHAQYVPYRCAMNRVHVHPAWMHTTIRVRAGWNRSVSNLVGYECVPEVLKVPPGSTSWNRRDAENHRRILRRQSGLSLFLESMCTLCNRHVTGGKVCILQHFVLG